MAQVEEGDIVLNVTDPSCIPDVSYQIEPRWLDLGWEFGTPPTTVCMLVFLSIMYR